MTCFSVHRRLGNNPIVFTAGMFDRFSNLTSLLLNDISAATLPTGIFDNLTQLQVLYALTAACVVPLSVLMDCV